MAMHSETSSHEAQEPREQPASRARPRPVAAEAAPRRHPDEEAMVLMMKVVERVEVAKSFAKLAAGLLTVGAARTAQQLRVVADAKMVEVAQRDGPLQVHYDRVRRIARAATEAAVHVATRRSEPAQTSPETEDAEP
jgi:hypothetical protein